MTETPWGSSASKQRVHFSQNKWLRMTCRFRNTSVRCLSPQCGHRSLKAPTGVTSSALKPDASGTPWTTHAGGNSANKNARLPPPRRPGPDRVARLPDLAPPPAGGRGACLSLISMMGSHCEFRKDHEIRRPGSDGEQTAGVRRSGLRLIELGQCAGFCPANKQWLANSSAINSESQSASRAAVTRGPQTAIGALGIVTFDARNLQDLDRHSSITCPLGYI